MIRVTIELWPKGDRRRARHLGTVAISNDATGTLTRGNYVVRLSRRKQPESPWRTARVERFPRRRLGPYWALRAAVGLRNVSGGGNGAFDGLGGVPMVLTPDRRETADKRPEIGPLMRGHHDG